MSKNKHQHFVPQHYLRQFRVEGTKQICVMRLSPPNYIGLGAINRQCQEDYFYEGEGDKGLDQVMSLIEADLAPVLESVCRKETFDPKQVTALQFLAIVLNVRTRKAIETAKLYPKCIADKFISNAIETGKLPSPKGGYRNGMIDFSGVASTLMFSAIPCLLEMLTLGCKLLKVPNGCRFITSDNPVVCLNQLFANDTSGRSFVGFSRSGFQLVLPISNKLALFFYDPNIYHVGSHNYRVIQLSSSDVEVVNSLQIQAAERCVYFQEPLAAPAIFQLAQKFHHLRASIQDSLRVIEGEGQSFVHMRTQGGRLLRPWSFCRIKQRKIIGPDLRRDPEWSALIKSLEMDMIKNPHSGHILDRLGKLLNTTFEEGDEQP